MPQAKSHQYTMQSGVRRHKDPAFYGTKTAAGQCGLPPICLPM
jgi:hypothetical protein